MASRKHCREDFEVEPKGKRSCQLDAPPDDDELKYNPSFLTAERTCPSSPGYTVDELRAIGRRLGIVVRGLTKTELVEAIRSKPC